MRRNSGEEGQRAQFSSHGGRAPDAEKSKQSWCRLVGRGVAARRVKTDEELAPVKCKKKKKGTNRAAEQLALDEEKFLDEAAAQADT